jgi:hypothetical protein
MKSWLPATIIVGVALVVFVFALVGTFSASIVALLVVMTVILVNNARRANVRAKP